MTEHNSPFILDVKKIQAEARRNMEAGAVTGTYGANREEVIKMLESALATEWLCVLRYTQHYHAAQGIHAEAVKAEFLEHANQERVHALKLGERIKQLGGVPHISPSTLSERSHAQYVECDNLVDMIKENLVAERIAVSAYQEMIRYIGEGDSTTRRMLEGIVEQEEEHADDMADLISTFEGR